MLLGYPNQAELEGGARGLCGEKKCIYRDQKEELHLQDLDVDGRIV